ncbi:MAG: hypothetical protein AAF456_23860 [Planctomycetota bacterium]
MTEFNEFEIPDELRQFEKQLAGLKPAAHLIDAQEIVFEAGRQSVLLERGPASSHSSVQRLAISSALLGAMAATAATILLLVSAGMLNPAGNTTPALSGVAEDIVDQENGVAVATAQADLLEPEELPAYRNVTSALNELDVAEIHFGANSRAVLTSSGGIFVDRVPCALSSPSD